MNIYNVRFRDTEGKWSVTRMHAGRASKLTDDRDAAVERARVLAQEQGEICVFELDGTKFAPYGTKLMCVCQPRKN